MIQSLSRYVNIVFSFISQ